MSGAIILVFLYGMTSWHGQGKTLPFVKRVHKIAKSDCELRHVCPQGTTRLPLDGFSLNLTSIFFENMSRKFKFH